ncbi:hypothetical protein F511_32456 [Dorcoceras hygrometricum]|uniref:Uncharacterized protein n=1 Tax=Dorcoceras hygrometricum TaxID=472368 RepID=A0A2Z7D948_9LAMI|nr:hypothetical protein F511_32456 [Dorcoceras hygrometricum]
MRDQRATIMATIVLKDPRLSSDTTVGAWLQPESQGDWLFTRAYCTVHRAALGRKSPPIDSNRGVEQHHLAGPPLAQQFAHNSTHRPRNMRDQRATIMATIVLKDPRLSSDTTVGKRWRIRIPSPGGASEV